MMHIPSHKAPAAIRPAQTLGEAIARSLLAESQPEPDHVYHERSLACLDGMIAAIARLKSSGTPVGMWPAGLEMIGPQLHHMRATTINAMRR